MQSLEMSEIPDLFNDGPSRSSSQQEPEDSDDGGTSNNAFTMTPEEEFLALDRDQTIKAIGKRSTAHQCSFIDSVHDHVSVPYAVHNYRRNRSDSIMVPLEVHRHVFNQRVFDREFGWQPRREYQEYRDVLRNTFCLTWRQLLTKFLSLFPIIDWLPKYNLRNHLLSDLIAGITVGVMHIPQGLAFASLANVPPVNGLYASFITAIAYMILGTSTHVSFGTFAVLSLLVGQVVKSHPLLGELIEDLEVMYGSNDTEVKQQMINELSVEISQTLTMLVGIFLVIMGVCHIGFITAYLSDQVIAGFSTGSGVLTVTSQLPAFSGLKLSRKSGPFSIFEIYIEFFSKFTEINWWAALVTAVAAIFLFVGKTYINPLTAKICRVPVPWDLLAVIIGTAVSYLCDLEHTARLSVIGEIPLGIQVGLPNLHGSMVTPMITDAISISFVVYVLTVSLGKLFAKKFHYTIDIAQEPYAYGLANIASSFFMGIACCAALGRCQVLADLHTCTPLHNLFTTGLLLLVLFVLASLFYSLPSAVLAAIIIVALKGVFLRFTQLPRLWRVSKYDFCIWVVSFIATVVLGVQLGLIVSILFALFSAILRSQWPPAVMQGHLPGTDIYHNKLRITLYDECGIDLKKARHEIAQIDTPVAPPKPKISHTKAETKEAKKASKKEKKAKTKAEHAEPKANKDQFDPTREPTERDRQLAQIRKKLDLPDVIVLVCSGFNYIDYMGVEVLTELYEEMSELGILLLYAVMKAQVRDMLAAAEFFDTVPKIHIFPTIHDAVTYGLYTVERNRFFEKNVSDEKLE